MTLQTLLDSPPTHRRSSCAAGSSGETGCTVCVEACPYQAIRLLHRPEGTVIDIDPGLCRRCGACTGLCPTSSLERSFQTDEDLYSLVSGALAEVDLIAPVVVFGCSQAKWNLARYLSDGAVFVELRSLLVLNENHLLQALRAGAGGVLLVGCPACHHQSPHLLADALELVRSLVGWDDIVAYVEDDLSDESRQRVVRFVEQRSGSPVLSSVTLTGGDRRQVLRRLLADELTPSSLVGESTFARMDVDQEACFMCGACSRACPTDALSYDPQTGVLGFSALDCVNCGLCTKACPVDAVELSPGLDDNLDLFKRRILVRDEVVACAGCQEPYLPQRLIDYSRATIAGLDRDLPRTVAQIDLCARCRDIEWERTAQRGRNGVGLPELDRRQFIKGVGAGAAGAALLAIAPSPAAATEQARQIEPKRLAMVIDMNRCIGCHACTAVCKAENHVPLGVYRDWVEEHELGVFPDARPVFLPKLCNHCDDPGCMRACPTGAIFRRADGIVDINHDICIGCRACNQACPYACTFMDPVRGTADKCNFCSHRVDQGLNPACVDVCPTGCRIFGDLDDPDSPPSVYLRDREPTVLRQELGLGPNVKYVGLPGELNR